MRRPFDQPHELEALLRRTYAAFNARDVDAVIAVLHSDVDWPNAWEGGRVRGHAAVRSYWARQLEAIDKSITAAGGSYLTGRKETGPNVYYEVKYKTPEGIVFDITESGWKGAVKEVKPA